MAAREFLFALEFSDEARFDSMLTELAGAVLAYAGYSRASADELRAVLRSALAAGLPEGERRCDIQFRAHAGELRIVVSYPSGAEWRTARPLPPPSGGER